MNKKLLATLTAVLMCAVLVWAAATANKTFTLNIGPAPIPPLVISTVSLPGGSATIAYSQALTATGGVAPYTWAVTAGTLPTGLTLSSTGLISGIPAVQGISTFTVTVTDSQSGTASVQVRSTSTAGM